MSVDFVVDLLICFSNESKDLFVGVLLEVQFDDVDLLFEFGVFEGGVALEFTGEVSLGA